MEPDGSFPCRQGTATGPYPEPDKSTLITDPTSLRSTVTLLHHANLGHPISFFQQQQTSA
jgi:hypothetical protein